MSTEFVAREVICDFEGRRRPVFFCYCESGSVKDAHGSLFSSVKSVFSDLIHRDDEESYFLQVNSDKHGVIDVVGCPEPIEDGETVFLRYWSRKTRARSPENDVSKINHPHVKFGGCASVYVLYCF